MEMFAISLLNGISYGLLLFMLSAGFTLIFSMMGVLNFAHASFYMLGAFLACTLGRVAGFIPALLLAPLLAGLAGAGLERYVLRRVHRFGHMHELLLTFGIAWVMSELARLIWGTSALSAALPAWLQGPLFSLHGVQFARTRALVMAISTGMLLCMWWLAGTRTGLLIRAATTHPHMVEALGHNVRRLFVWVFGAGCALAALAGAAGSAIFVTEPSMANAVGPIIFVIVMLGGLGSLKGAFLAAMLIGLLQTFAVTLDRQALGGITLAQTAPVLPYLLLVMMLALRPQGLFGQKQADWA